MTRTPPKTAAGRGVRRASGRAAWVETVGGFRDRSGPPCSQGEHPNALGLPNPAIPCHRPVTRSSPTARRSTTGPAQLALRGSRFCGSKPIDTVSSHPAGGRTNLGSRFCRPKPIDLDPSASAGQARSVGSSGSADRSQSSSLRSCRGLPNPANSCQTCRPQRHPHHALDRQRPTSRPHATEYPNDENPACPDQIAINEGLSNPVNCVRRSWGKEDVMS
ncbi:MAG: hypothetical protein JWO38_2562 [Gemmataceae bacterium]|nr:hypothetical protein [Gemmataceae bacterium]